MKSYACCQAADILLPARQTIEEGKWAAIACDQFTSEPHYWEAADRLVGDAPSTLRIMLPEVYLNETAERLPAIHAAMKGALADHLICHNNAMIAVARTQSDGRIRRGLVAQIDLEQYDYRKGSTALIRATEGTVLERIPPRVAVRRDALLEMPHVMLLIDDPDATVLEPLFEESIPHEIAYDTDLMLGGGHIKGHFLTAEEQSRVLRTLDALITPEAMTARYGDATLAPLLFAVGDGNHSLATAKASFEEIKAAIGEEAAASHPARYALVEIVNLHDKALSFEPIYRVMFGVDPTDVLESLRAYVANLSGTAAPQNVRCIGAFEAQDVVIERPVQQLTVGTLQAFIDEYLSTHPGASVDYIHGVESTSALASKPDAIGFLFDGMEKSQLFRTVIYDGALPRKTFSMGHAQDKRYYMECRKIK
ncbi:MAG: DUF1015 domain-containing protein [Ruminococcaceae bacterium]|nr:DUF1015 domain-containing protein [Oscillospiraceae bacterium]